MILYHNIIKGINNIDILNQMRMTYTYWEMVENEKEE
jgi:hypothetical protein